MHKLPPFYFNAFYRVHNTSGIDVGALCFRLPYLQHDKNTENALIGCND